MKSKRVSRAVATGALVVLKQMAVVVGTLDVKIGVFVVFSLAAVCLDVSASESH